MLEFLGLLALLCFGAPILTGLIAHYFGDIIHRKYDDVWILEGHKPSGEKVELFKCRNKDCNCVCDVRDSLYKHGFYGFTCTLSGEPKRTP